MNRDIEFERWVDDAKALTVEKAADLVKFEPKRGYAKTHERMGACPRCGGNDRFAINVTRNVWNCRGCGKGGRDGIGMVMWCLDLTFFDACEAIVGPRPQPPKDESDQDREARRQRVAERIAEIERDRTAADEKRESETNEYRERERRKAFDWWRHSYLLPGSEAESYLRARGLDLPPDLRLRWHPQWTLFDGVDDWGKPAAVHRGPALFAPIVENGTDGERFCGLHITWFDPRQPGRKIMVRGEGDDLVPAKKMRGIKAGGHIVLVRGDAAPRRLFIGEGIETVLSVWTALNTTGSALLDGAAFWTSADLGNLAGKALDRLVHPSETKADRLGRVRHVKVPGIVPDPASRAVVIPASVTDLFLIGDGDSEPFRTRCVLARAVTRHGRPGLAIRTVIATPGKDFNDMITVDAA